MKGLKTVVIVLGIILMVLGVICIFHPGSSIMFVAWLTGIVMLVEGITSIVGWVRARQSGNTNGWFLAAALLSILFGALLVFSNVSKFTYALLLSILAAVWLISTGALRIVSAVKLHRVYKNSDHILGRRWLLLMAIGVVMAAIGVVGLFAPQVLALAFGVYLGVYMLISGANIVALGFSLGSAHKNSERKTRGMTEEVPEAEVVYEVEEEETDA